MFGKSTQKYYINFYINILKNINIFTTNVKIIDFFCKNYSDIPEIYLVGENPAICFEKNQQKVTILASSYYNLIYLSHAVNLIYDICKNHTQDVKKKVFEFINLIDSKDNKFTAYNKIINSDKFKQIFLDYDIAGSCLGFIIE